ncbi:hypothetical protein V8D89_000444 [Ganoderma adspersum]
MLVLLCVLRRSGRSASTKLARPMADSSPTSKNPNPSRSSIRDTVILISPDRETPPASVGVTTRRSSDSQYSQYSRHSTSDKIKPRLSLSIPQLPAIDLSPPLLALSPYSLESEYRPRAYALSPPPPSAPSRSYMYSGSESADAWRASTGRSVSSERIPSVRVIGSFGSDRRGLPRLIEADEDAHVAAPPAMMSVNPARTAALLPPHGHGR